MSNDPNLYTVPWYNCDPKDFPPRWKYVRAQILKARRLAEKRQALASERGAVVAEASTAASASASASAPAAPETASEPSRVPAVAPFASPASSKPSWASVIQSHQPKPPIQTQAPQPQTQPQPQAPPQAHQQPQAPVQPQTQPETPVESLSNDFEKSQLVDSPPAESAAAPPVAAAKKRQPIGEIIAGYMNTPSLSYYDPAVHTKREPRGLINTGNLCFMNSTLQVLIHCTPFYHLIDEIGKYSAFQLRSDTPILDGLVDFTKEFNQRVPRDSGQSVQPDPFLPESFYRVLSGLARFSHLERGRQEDAQEFLGTLLEEMHEESTRALTGTLTNGQSGSPGDEPLGGSTASGWVEVTKKKPTVRYSGTVGIETPITRLFGGQFESVLRVPRQSKPSITYDPFQQVQLDISDPRVQSIEDAFKLMSTPESLPYRTSQGDTVNATKQVFFKKLPAVLIVHLKRFIFEGNESRKLAKHVGFGTHLDIPAETISSRSEDSPPIGYSLFAVVYHHGVSTAAGHYTVEVKGGPNGEVDKWTNIDDISIQSIERVGQGDDSHKTAYLLFYVRD